MKVRKLTQQQIQKLERIQHLRDEAPMRDLPLLLTSLVLCFEILKEVGIIQPIQLSEPIVQPPPQLQTPVRKQTDESSQSANSVGSSSDSYSNTAFSGSSSDYSVNGGAYPSPITPSTSDSSKHPQTEKLSLLLSRNLSHGPSSQVSLPESSVSESSSPIENLLKNFNVKRSPTSFTSLTAVSIPMLIPLDLQRGDSVSTNNSSNSDSLSTNNSFRFSKSVYRKSRFFGSLVTTNSTLEESDDEVKEKPTYEGLVSDQPPKLDFGEEHKIGLDFDFDFGDDSFGLVEFLTNNIMQARR